MSVSRLTAAKSYTHKHHAIKNLIKQGEAGAIPLSTISKRPNNLANWTAVSRARVSQVISNHRSIKTSAIEPFSPVTEKNLPERTKYKIKSIG